MVDDAASVYARARLYDRAAPVYDHVGPRIFSRFGERLVELAHLASDARVLDVATGRGAILFPASAQIQRGQIIGVDLSEPMLRETQAEIKPRGVSNVALARMNGEILACADSSFDQLLCGFAIFWLPHLEIALNEFHRVLRSAGRLGISMSGGPDARWQWYRDLLRQNDKRYHIFEDTGSTVNGKPDELRAALMRSGFSDIETTIETFDIVYANEDEWWSAQWMHGSRLPLEKFSPNVLEQFKADAFEGIQALKKSDGFHEAWHVVFALARKSD